MNAPHPCDQLRGPTLRRICRGEGVTAEVRERYLRLWFKDGRIDCAPLEAAGLGCNPDQAHVVRHVASTDCGCARRKARLNAILPGAGDLVESVASATGVKALVDGWSDNRLEALCDDLIDRTEIVVKSFRRHAALRRFVESVKRHYPAIRVRIVDDSFPDQIGNDTLEMLAQLPGVTVTITPHDIGLPAGRNVGIRESEAEFVVICDDDFVFTCETNLAAMLLPIHEGHVDLCGGLVRMDGKTAQNWQGRFAFKDRIDGKRDLHLYAITPETSPVEELAGYTFRRSDITFNFFAARRSVLVANPYDEQFRITNEHLDSFLTWWQAGVRVAFTPDCICGHRHETSDEYKRLRNRSHAGKLSTKWKLGGRHLCPRTTYTGIPAAEEIGPMPSPTKPNLIVLTIGRSGSSILTKMLMAAGWNCPRADEEFAEHVQARTLNSQTIAGRTFDATAAASILNGMPAPWVLKDPRFTWTLRHWKPLLEPYRPTLVYIVRDMESVEESFRRQKWGHDGRDGYEFSGVPLAKQRQWCDNYFDGWPWGKIRVEYEQLHAALRLFDVSRGSVRESS